MYVKDIRTKSELHKEPSKLFHLTKDHPEMAEDEVLFLARGKIEARYGDLLVVKTNKNGLAQRLAYTRAVYRFLFECQSSDLFSAIKNVSWQNHVKGSVAVRFHGNKNQEPELASAILSKVRNPRVDLEHPKTRIDLFSRNGNIICGILEGDNKGGFESRKAHLRPSPHPSSMHPRLARWFVNRTGITKGVVVDPFCGSGGILLEAVLLGFAVQGFDLDQDMIGRSKENLKGVKSKVKLQVKDALTISKPLKYLVTDLPYGKSTRASDLKTLYKGFLSVLEKNLTGRAVIGYPDFIDLYSMAKSNNLKIEACYKFYLHKSLTKKIIVVSALR